MSLSSQQSRVFLSKLQNSNVSLVWFSPHLDDAILSCGALLYSLARTYSQNIKIITIFTKADNRCQTLSAKSFLRTCRVQDPDRLFELRRNEDKLVMQTLGIDFQHSGFVDALWRKKVQFNKIFGIILPESAHLYPIYKYHLKSGKVHAQDKDIIDQITKKVLELNTKKKQTIFFFPLGLGGHPDHVLTYQVANNLNLNNIIFYSDFPYNLKDCQNEDTMIQKGYIKYEFQDSLDEKDALIESYKTQKLFDGNIPKIAERYFVKPDLIF